MFLLSILSNIYSYASISRILFLIPLLLNSFVLDSFFFSPYFVPSPTFHFSLSSFSSITTQSCQSFDFFLTETAWHIGSLRAPPRDENCPNCANFSLFAFLSRNYCSVNHLANKQRFT
jgi:hypothetical protein